MRALILVVVSLAACSDSTVRPSSSNAPPATTTPAQAEPAAQAVQVVAQDLEVPWAIVFTASDRMLVTERPGRVRAVENGKLRPQPLLTLTDVVATGEAGLMGMAVHPSEPFVYLCYCDKSMNDRVVRYRDAGTALVEPKVILANIPAARYHAGCELKFGPDRKLYITTGDATDRNIAQDLRSLGGKILRLEDDGTIPSDNPFPNSPVWSYGHRNPQGIDWDPKGGLLWETEHGPSGFDGGSGGDEVNIVERGKNYGWPVIHHDETREGMVSPVREYSPAVAPGSAAFWHGDFYFGCLRGQHLHRLVLDPNDRRRIVREEKLFTDLGRIREVTVGPDNALYFSTSNHDGRGNASSNDDRIFRVAR